MLKNVAHNSLQRALMCNLQNEMNEWMKMEMEI